MSAIPPSTGPRWVAETSTTRGSSRTTALMSLMAPFHLRSHSGLLAVTRNLHGWPRVGLEIRDDLKGVTTAHIACGLPPQRSNRPPGLSIMGMRLPATFDRSTEPEKPLTATVRLSSAFGPSRNCAPPPL